ncbi:MAG TPA: ATP-grasp domain-containing protein [Acidobacteriota bacterium]|nr:ATP-grasp domain-containing protein [Acidobacteriota bacterium]
MKYDCVVLYNAANISEREGCEEKIYPANIVREDVSAIEESLRRGGYRPCVIAVESFSRDLVRTLAEIAPRFVFNLCEEINGKPELEMCVAGLLELMGIPFTGSDPYTLGLALNKFHVKQVLRAAGVPTARGYVRYPGQALTVPRGARFPLIVKPARQDASLGINSNSVCSSPEQLEKQIRYIHEVYDQEALVEEYLDGREFNVSVVGDRNPEVLAVSEIDFTGLPDDEPRIVSYRAKWDEESLVFNSTVPLCPAPIPRRLESRIRAIAIRSYQCTGCRDYARIDMRTNARGGVYVLEVNPNPDISPKAGFARAVRAAGYSYSDMILRIGESAVERGAKITAAVYAF